MYLKCIYTHDNLNVGSGLFYPQLLTPDLAQTWYLYLEEMLPHSTKRDAVLFGDPGLIYKVTYQGTTSERPVYPWSDLPALTELKTLIEKTTEQQYTVCVICPTAISVSPHIKIKKWS